MQQLLPSTLLPLLHFIQMITESQVCPLFKDNRVRRPTEGEVANLLSSPYLLANAHRCYTRGNFSHSDENNGNFSNQRIKALDDKDLPGGYSTEERLAVVGSSFVKLV